jgi:hypothetical protein
MKHNAVAAKMPTSPSRRNSTPLPLSTDGGSGRVGRKFIRSHARCPYHPNSDFFSGFHSHYFKLLFLFYYLVLRQFIPWTSRQNSDEADTIGLAPHRPSLGNRVSTPPSSVPAPFPKPHPMTSLLLIR